jgi:hypothetical protein
MVHHLLVRFNQQRFLLAHHQVFPCIKIEPAGLHCKTASWRDFGDWTEVGVFFFLLPAYIHDHSRPILMFWGKRQK